MSILLFRRQIETLLSDLIGEYTLPNGQQTPAIRVREGEEQLDENTAVEGLEVIIEVYFPEGSRALYSGVPQWPIYHVRLVQWSDFNFDEAVLRLRSTYDNSRTIPLSVPAEIGPTRQCIVAIKSSSPYMSELKMEAP
jgi:hypothetical protein